MNKQVIRTIAGTYFAAICVFYTQSMAQGVTIGSPNPPDPSAVLDVQSNGSGFLPPRLTTLQRNGIANPAEGLTVYNTDTKCLEVYFPSGWSSVGCECSGPPATPTQINGSLHVCPSQTAVTFSVQNVPGATGYTWVVPNQDVLVSGQGTSSIVVDFSSNPGIRTLSVVATNSCGSSPSYSIAVDVSNPSATFTSSPNFITTSAPVTFTANTPNASYSWIFPGGSPGTSVNSPATVSWSNAGTYSVSLTVTDNDGCTSTSTSPVVVSSCPTPGTTSQTFSFTGSLQTWVVPACAATITIEARGGQGGNTGGLGARMIGTFNVTPGSTLNLVVGGSGGNSSGNSNNSGGGGGGSFVYQGNTLLIAAGGGGGRCVYSGSVHSGAHGTTNGNGNSSSGGHAGGTSGMGGTTTSYGGGGGGWSGSASGAIGGQGGLSFAGGNGFCSGGGGGCGGTGAYGGGGGGGNAYGGGGGGGGYSGGGGGSDPHHGGGGGSFNSGTNPSNTSGFQTGAGTIIITY